MTLLELMLVILGTLFLAILLVIGAFVISHIVAEWIKQ